MHATLLLVSLCASPLPTAEEIHALYMENALQAQTLRVQWSTEFDGSERRRLAGVRSSLMESALQLNKIPKQLFDKVSRQASTLKRRAEQDAALSLRTASHDYWSDRRNFQTRSPWYDDSGGPVRRGELIGFTFPDVEATRDTLSEVFGKIYILSHGPATDNRFRVWEGQQVDVGSGAQGTGQVQLEMPKPGCRFPPLALPAPEWEGTPHPVDEFFVRFLEPGRSRVLGMVELEGVQTLLIESEIDGGTHPAAKYSTARAFIDLEQGGIPRRIEFLLSSITEHGQHLGLCVDHPELRADRITRDIAVETIEEGGARVFYPMSGVTQHLSRAPAPEYAISPSQPEMAVYDEDRWQVESVELNRPMTEAGFALEFPANTVFHNGLTNEMFVVGDVEGHMERIVQGSTNAPRRRLYNAWYRLAAAVAIALAGLALWIYFRVLKPRTRN